MMAGQAADPWRFSSATFGERIDHELGDRIGGWPDWAPLLRERNVFRAHLSHDLMIWERDDSPIGHPVIR